MKVQTLHRDFYWKDTTRECMVLKKKWEVFEVNPDKDAQQIYEMLQARRIEIVDSSFIPSTARYVGIHNYNEQREDGSWLKISPGQTITLSQSTAGRLMIGGYIRPELESAWRPQMLLTGGISTAPAKRMFDEPEPERNWVKGYKK